MTKRYDVAGLGNAIVDVIAPVDDAFLLEHNIAKGVMTLIDAHRAGQLYHVLTRAQEVAGGSAANTMAGLASLGGKGLFVGKVKADRLGQSFADSLNTLGIVYATKMAGDGPQTACCLIAVTPDGHRSMNTYLGASREISQSDIDEEEIAAADILYVEGYLWDTPEAKGAINKAVAAAKSARRKVAFSLSDPFCVARWREEFLALMTGIDILFANEEEAKALFGANDFDAVLQATRQWPGIAALTRSEKGCVVAARRRGACAGRRACLAGGRHHRRRRSVCGRVPLWFDARENTGAGRKAWRACGRRSDLTLRCAARSFAQRIRCGSGISLIILPEYAARPPDRAGNRDVRTDRVPAMCRGSSFRRERESTMWFA